MKTHILFILPVLLLSAAVAFGQPFHGEGFKKFIKDLNLTEEQKKEVEKIHLDLQKKMIDQKAKSETARLELQQLLKADNPDRSAIEKKLTEIADLDAKMHMLRVDS